MKLLVLDGNSIANRAFYGVKALTTSDGRYTNAVFGFLNILTGLVRDYTPDAVCVAFDVHEPTFRHKMYAEYKGNRKGMPEELREQMPVIRKLAADLGYRVTEAPGWEADDILGTLASHAGEQDHCFIATGDRDSLQLVNDRVTVLLSGTKGTVAYDPAAVQADKGVSPRQLIDVKALMGDASDNIPGVPGIGEKTATKLIAEFGSVDGVYENLETGSFSPSVKRKLTEGRDLALLSRTLGTIVFDAPIDTDYAAYAIGPMNAQAVKQTLTSLEMTRMIDKLGLRDVELTANAPETAAQAELFDGSFDALVALIGEDAPVYIWFSEDLSDCAAAVSLEDALKCKRLTADEGLRLTALSHGKKTVNCTKELYKKAFDEDRTVSGIVFDTTLAGYLLDPNGTDYDVAILAEKYGIASGLETEDAALKRVSLMEAVADRQAEKLEETGARGLLDDIELPLAEVLASMEHVGMRVDAQGIHDFGVMLDGRIDALVGSIYDYAGASFNINSPKQLGVVLFETLGLPAKKKTKTGYSTNADVLEGLRDAHPIIGDILQYRTLTKLKSTYCDGLLKAVCADGRIHSTFRQTETRTGRLSSTEPNLQNIPVRSELGREMRKFFVAESGNVLLDADYSQIELRVLAAIANDENMLAAFNDGTDIHTVTASQVFGMPVDMVTPLMRSRAKAVNFGIVYGIGAYSLSQDIDVPVYEAKQYIQNYLRHYEGVDRYMKDVIEQAKTDGYVQTLYGRRRYLPELTAANAVTRAFGERVARNMPIQGTAADIIKIAMIGVYRRLRRENLRSKLIMQVHDELIIESPEDEAEQVLALLKEEMESAVQMRVKFTVDAHQGRTWYEAKG